MASDLSSEPKFRLADRLAAARQGRFVGREAELQLFRSALLADEAPFAVLHIYGPGGVGKTTLLREYARLARDSGRPVVRLDGRNIDPSPPGFLLALRQAKGLDEAEPSLTLSTWPANGVLFIDTYETLAPLDSWLRETFLPQLPGQSLVVIAGRNPPAPAWRTDIGWAGLAHFSSLRNLRPEESQTYLAVRGIPQERHREVLAFTHGHPLALSLLADVLSQGEATFNPQNEPDVVRILLERLVQDVPGPKHRLALDVCVMAWATNEALLAEALGREEAHELFEWLRRLSFIEQGQYGLFPHDLAREALDADSRWRNPEGYHALQQRVLVYLRSKFQRTTGLEQQRVRLDILYLSRHKPGLKPFFDWEAFGSGYAEPALPEDATAIVEMVRKHEGEASAQLALYWLQHQPQAFLVFRSPDGRLFGFMANLELHRLTPEELAADPALSAALNFTQRYGPIRPGEEMVYLRFWMGAETYQAVAPAINLAASNSVTYWATHPRLAWNFIAMSQPDFWQPHFDSINIQRSPEADFEVGGRRYGVYTHDWRVEPASVWQAGRPAPASATMPDSKKPVLPLLVLSQPEFEEAVRQALRDYSRLDLLAANPLMRSRLVLEAAEQPLSPATLQTLLREAAGTLSGNPKDEKLYRAIYHTYLEPAPTQERAAELLDLPFSTYRYHLTQGLKRLIEGLWQRELRDFER